MTKLSNDLICFFQSSENGFTLLQTESQKANKILIAKVYECICQESFTKTDIKHLYKFKELIKIIPFGEFYRIEEVIDIELKLLTSGFRQELRCSNKTLEYIFNLLTRYGYTAGNKETLTLDLSIYRRVKNSKGFEGKILIEFINWLIDHQYSKRHIPDTLREVEKFAIWLSEINLKVDLVDNTVISQYLNQRAFGLKRNTLMRIISELKSFLAFYKECFNPSLILPDLTIAENRDKYKECILTLERIEKLHQYIRSDSHNIQKVLMLYLILVYHVPPKCMRLVTINGNQLSYKYQPSSRTGEEIIYISINEDSFLKGIIENLRINNECSYLIQTTHSVKKDKPVACDYCSKTLSRYISQILGFKISMGTDL